MLNIRPVIRKRYVARKLLMNPLHLFIVVLSIAVFLITYIWMVYVLFVKIIPNTRKRDGKWGINLRPATCPECSKQLPPFRKPTSLKQGLWGGWSCPNCGAEVNKWGSVVHEDRAT